MCYYFSVYVPPNHVMEMFLFCFFPSHLHFDGNQACVANLNTFI